VFERAILEPRPGAFYPADWLRPAAQDTAGVVRTLFVAVRAALYSTGFILFWGWLAVRAVRYEAILGVELPAVLKPVGIVAAVAGALLCLACILTFIVRGRGTPAPFDPPVVFVPTGSYRYVRNPMYIGAALVLAGYGLFQRSASVLLLSAGFLLIMHLFVILLEEPGLERRFGDSYVAYKRAVNRWLPRAPRQGH
jgi:protein-S-isoprenylcysteine O-methyltransferase Ste14